MQIEVTARSPVIGSDMKAYAGKKAERLVKYYNRVQSIRVVLGVEGRESTCEMIAALEHRHDLVGTATNPDMRGDRRDGGPPGAPVGGAQGSRP